MQVGDIPRLRLEKQRLQRDGAALGAGKVRELEWQRDRHPVEFDCEAPDLPQAELLENGPGPGSDSPAKFERMLSCFGVLISQAQQGEFQLDPERGGACSGTDLPVEPDGWGGIAAGRTGLAEGKAEAGSAGEGTEQIAAAQQGLFGTRAVGSVE